MTANLLPLETFRRQLGFNPWHFWQLANKKMPITSSCDTLVRQSAWQFADAAGRDEIEEAIGLAEAKLTKHLGYTPGQHWQTQELDITGGYWYGNPRWISRLKFGKVLALGVPTTAKLGTANVQFFDKDGDGLNETFEATLANSTVTDLSQLNAFLTSADWVGWESNDQADYEVRPVIFSRPDANTLKVTGPKWLLVKPAKYQGVGNQPGYDNSQVGLDSSGALDPDGAGNFVSSLDIYQTAVATADANKATVSYYDASNNPASYTVNLLALDWETGQFGVNQSCWDPAPGYYCCAQGQNPYRKLTVSYLAGDDLANWEMIITRLALAELVRPICGCKEANRQAERWYQDAARSKGHLEEQFRISNHDLDNPIGTLWGHIQAWRRIKEHRLQLGIAI